MMNSIINAMMRMKISDSLLVASMGIFLGFFIWWFIELKRNERGKLFSPAVIAVAGIDLSAVIALLPAYSVENNFVTAFLHSFQHSIRLFVADDNFENIEKVGAELFGLLNKDIYYWWVQLLFIIAPLVTFSSLLYVFTRVWNHIRNITGRETYVFSELNERTIMLAESVKEIGNNKKVLIVFADIIDKKEEEHLDLVDRATKLHAILFRKDITAIRFYHLKKRAMRFYLVSDNEEEKLRHAQYIVDKYNTVNSELYICSDSLESELFVKKYADKAKMLSKEEEKTKKYISLGFFKTLSKGEEIEADAEKYLDKILNEAVTKKEIKIKKYITEAQKYCVRKNEAKAEKYLNKARHAKFEIIRDGSLKIKGIRINEIRFLVNQYFYETGSHLFYNAFDNEGIKTIYATILGYGRHGKEFLKSLLWYCQLPGYKVDITVMDSDPSAESRFNAEFPSLETDKDHNSSEDMRYRISFKNVAFGTKEFINEITKEKASTNNIFVCLGDDNLNIKACRAIDMEYLRRGLCASITAIVRNAALKVLVENKSIKIIGDFDNYYSINIFSLDNKLIKLGFEEHTYWAKITEMKKKQEAKEQGEEAQRDNSVQTDDEEYWSNRYAETTFYFNDYNFYSSISKAIHRGLRFKGTHPELEPKYEAFFEKTKNVKEAIDFKTNGNFESLIEGVKKESLDEFRLKIEKQKKRNKRECAISEEKLKNDQELEKTLRTIAEIDHVRWNAYMRAEGYIWSKDKDLEYKMHSDLLPVGQLTCGQVINDF